MTWFASNALSTELRVSIFNSAEAQGDIISLGGVKSSTYDDADKHPSFSLDFTSLL
jgi:hypothetical protein